MKAATSSLVALLSRGVFQSTPPVKAATFTGGVNIKITDISIHAAREGGDGMSGATFDFKLISIHAAREGGDRGGKIFPCDDGDFNPRRP